MAHRAPWRFEEDPEGQRRLTRTLDGLVGTLEPLARTHAGIWITHGEEPADNYSRQPVSDAASAHGYHLRHVPLSSDEYRRYYDGFAHEGLWPLCHDVGVRPAFRAEDCAAYHTANARFAAAALQAAGTDGSLILVQDYHLALTPRILHDHACHAIVTFWHVPFPRPRVFAGCPQARELLDGLLGSHIVGFQTQDDCQNFLGAVESLLDAAVDRSQCRVTYRGKTTYARVYPVGIEWQSQALKACPPVGACRDRIRGAFGVPPDGALVVGVDRMEYTQGIHEKFVAFERLLATRADLRGRVVLVQLAEPSRECLPAYGATRAHAIETSDRVNARFGSGSYSPIHLLERRHDPAEVYPFYRAADLCYVGCLHDGMNLVAKAFVAARDDERGVLILSEFAGAAQQLRAALLVDPRDADQCADAVTRGLEMAAAEQSVRMRMLRANVGTFDGAWWARQVMSDAALHRPHESP